MSIKFCLRLLTKQNYDNINHTIGFHPVARKLMLICHSAKGKGWTDSPTHKRIVAKQLSQNCFHTTKERLEMKPESHSSWDQYFNHWNASAIRPIKFWVCNTQGRDFEKCVFLQMTWSNVAEHALNKPLSSTVARCCTELRLRQVNINYTTSNDARSLRCSQACSRAGM